MVRETIGILSSCKPPSKPKGSDCKWYSKCKWQWVAVVEYDEVNSCSQHHLLHIIIKHLILWLNRLIGLDKGRSLTGKIVTSQTMLMIFVWLKQTPLSIIKCIATTLSRIDSSSAKMQMKTCVCSLAKPKSHISFQEKMSHNHV